MTAPADLLDHDGRPATGLWSLDPQVLHLNHGSFGAVPTAALAHQAELKQLMESSPVRWFTQLPERLARARIAIEEFLVAPTDSVALVPNASAGITVALNSLDLAPGAEIVITDHAYGAVRMAAERAVSRVGGAVRTVAVPLAADADEVVALVEATITSRTAAVVVDAISSATARRFRFRN